MAVNNPTPATRKLGDYLGCSAGVIESALDRQGSLSVSKRLGEVLLAAEQISRDDLVASIKAQRLDRLSQCPLFAGLEREQVASLAEGFEEISIGTGQQIIHQDQSEPYIFVLAAGLLEVYRTGDDGEETRLSVVLPGEPIGEIGYFSNGQRSASVRGLEACELLRMHYDRLTECFEESPSLAHTFMDVVSERLRRTNELYQDNQYRLRTAERSLKHLNEFLDLSDAAELGAGIEGLIDRLVRTASNITDADRASLFLIDAITGDLWSKVAQGAEVKEIRVPRGAGIVGWVAENKQILNIPDAYDDGRFNPAVDKKTGYRTRTILCAPMWSLRNEILGVVQVINKGTGIFNEDDEALLRAFAHQAAVAVENFNLYRKMMANHRKMAIMLDISASINHTLDLSTLIREIVTKTTDVLQCDRSSFFVLDHETKELWSMEAHGSDLKEIRLPSTAGLAGHAATTGEVVNITDAYQDERFKSDFDKKTGYRTRSVLCMPVFDREGRVAGVTQAINKLDGIFDEEDVDLLRAVSSQIGVSLENAKLHANTLQMKNYLERVQQSISNSILTLDPDFSVVTVNKAAIEMFPAAGGEEPERDIEKILGPGNQHLVDVMKQVHQSHQSIVEYDVDLHAAGAETSTVNLNVLPLTDGEEEFQGLVMVLEDITSEKRVKSAFSHYLAPAVIEQLLEDPNRLALGGEKREMTFLFTDIAGFTTLSERVEPTVVVKLLNEYFDKMCSIVLDHGGTIDKIVGDALHVMFNAPTDQPDHAERAVRCALDLSVFCNDFSATQAEQSIALGETRLGINTGPAVVGNFGGTTRFDYTAYGDTINTAARLEGANKYLGTSICVSHETKTQCPDTVFRPVGRLVLKGKTEAIEVFEPLTDIDTPPDKLSAYLKAYGLMERLEAQALPVFEGLAGQFPDDRLIAYHAKRLADGETGTTIVMTGK